jgi:hypothetical protein
LAFDDGNHTSTNSNIVCEVSVDERPNTGLALGTAEIADAVVEQTVTKKDHSSAAFIRDLTPEAF